MVDNQSLIHAWQNRGGRSHLLNEALKRLFFTTIDLHVSTCLDYVPTKENPADQPSRRLSSLDSTLTPKIWNLVQTEFGTELGHSCDLMALDSNSMKDYSGNPLPHFTPYPSPDSLGVNFFAQDLSSHSSHLQRPYVFPPLLLIGPVLRFLQSHNQACTMLILDVYPRKYWWPALQRASRRAYKLASKGDTDALLVPTRDGWKPHPGLPGDLLAFAVVFNA